MYGQTAVATALGPTWISNESCILLEFFKGGLALASKDAFHMERSYFWLLVHNYPSTPLDSGSTQMFSHLLAASRHCILVGGEYVLIKERDSLGEKVGEVQR